MKFIIHSKHLLDEALKLEKQLGQCYIPGRDTLQDHGDNILKANLKAMMQSDKEVYVIWDGGSMGTLFDMGMAYALSKVIIPVKLVGGRNWAEYFGSKIGKTISYEDYTSLS